MTFATDLAVGREAEREFARVLLNDMKDFRVVSLKFSQGKFKDWDIKVDCIPYGEVTYEVKLDRQAQDTGNFVVEFRDRSGHASGIYVSKADYVVYCVKGEWRIQERGELILRLIDVEKEEVKGGDGKQTSMWKIGCDKLPVLFTKVEVNEQRGEETSEGTGEAG